MFNTFSLPGFQCIDGLLLLECLQLSAGKGSDSKRLLSRVFPDFGIFLFQQSATGTFISIDKFTKFCSQLRTEHYMHTLNVMILLYHRLYYRTSVLFSFFLNSSPHLQRKENSCYIIVKMSVIPICFIIDLTDIFLCYFIV